MKFGWVGWHACGNSLWFSLHIEMIHPLIWKRLLPDSLVTSIHARYEIWNAAYPRDPQSLPQWISEMPSISSPGHHNYNPWRIHGAAIYGVPWIPSRNTPFMLALIYQHQPDPSWVMYCAVSIEIPVPGIRPRYCEHPLNLQGSQLSGCPSLVGLDETNGSARGVGARGR